MFARVSTYRTSTDATGEPTEETIKRVLELPGCLGLYYLKGNDNKALSISLWDTEEDLGGSQQPANQIRSETSKEQHMEILDVKEFEVLTSRLKD
jgi:heme-degrading monooxygenase HmoA